jgi:hypothetical protein
LLKEVLYKAQATRRGAISRNNPNGNSLSINPRLLDGSTTLLASISLAPNPKLKIAYNRSKKHAKRDASNDKDRGALVLKKVDLRYTIVGLSTKMVYRRKA